MTTFVTILLLAALVFNTDAALNDSIAEPIPASSPTLKPATPIAGTNLLLNIMYKWHDHTRPDCFVTKIGKSNICSVCDIDDQQYYDTKDSSWYLERCDGKESMDEFYGTFQIKNLANRYVVGHMLPFLNVVSLFPEQYNNYWFARADPYDKNNVTFETVRYDYRIYEYKSSSDPNRYLLGLKPRSATNFPYSMVAEIKLEANMYSFEFTEPPSGAIEAATSKKDLIDSYDINNNSPASLTRVITVSQKITNEFSWGLSESLKSFAKVTGKAGIPFLASTEVETGFEFDVSSNQNWKSSEEKTFEMSYSANVPPYTTVKISAWYDLTKDISMDYTSETEITGKGTRMTIYDDVVDSPVTGDMIRKYLEHIKFDGTVVQIKENSVITRVKGTMVASVGLRGQLNVDGKPVVEE